MTQTNAELITLAAALLPSSISTSVTPGANNLMVTASAVNFGFRRTIPHMLGITFGFPVMLLAVGFGVGRVLTAYPSLHETLTVVGAVYLLFLARKIGSAAPASDSEAAAKARRPITFLQAALFQWVNPKAWIMALSAVTTYTKPDARFPLQLILIATMFAIVAFPSVAVWAGCGRALTRALRSPRAFRIFNYSMAALLVGSLGLLSSRPNDSERQPRANKHLQPSQRPSLDNVARKSS